MSVDEVGRNFRSEKYRGADALALDTGDFTMLVADALQKDYGHGRHAVKRIAAAANSNTRTAKNWLYGVNAPDALNLLRLMAQSPALAGEVRRLTSMQASLDPEFERAFNATMQLFMKVTAGGAT